MQSDRIPGWLLAVTTAALALLPQVGRTAAREANPPGAATSALSRYLPALRGTPGDSVLHILDSGKKGGTVLIVGGTHGNEPAGYVTAALVAENARPTVGRLLVLPYANAGAVAHPGGRAGAPRAFSLKTPGGERTFPFGSRLTNPADEPPDPAVYTHPRATKAVAGETVRNLNRVYPGKPDGRLTEKIAFAIVELIRAEEVDLAVDLHEANPDSPLKNVLIAHERAMDVAAETVLRLEADGMNLRLDFSPPGMHGLSHREWGDNTKALAVLMETVNPAQGPRGTGADEAVIVFGRNGNPLAERVARHATALNVLIRVYTEQHPARPVTVTGIPDFAAIKADLGKYLAPQAAGTGGAGRKKP